MKKKNHSVTLNSTMILNEEIQPLQQSEQRKRVFMMGNLTRMCEFIDYIKSRQNLYKSSQIDDGHIEQECENQFKSSIGSVSFKYPLKGSKIRQLLQESRGFLSKNNNMMIEDTDMASNEEEEDTVKLYTHSDPYYDLIKLKSSSSSLNSSEQLVRARNNSATSSSNNSIGSPQFHGNNNTNSNSESISLLMQHIELKQQIVEIQKQQMHQSQLYMELMQTVLLTMKEPSYSQKYKKEQQQSNEGINNNNNQFVASVSIMERVFELIGKENVIGYMEIATILEKEGYKYYDIMSTIANNKPQIDTLIDIFSRPNQLIPNQNHPYIIEQQKQQMQYTNKVIENDSHHSYIQEEQPNESLQHTVNNNMAQKNIVQNPMNNNVHIQQISIDGLIKSNEQQYQYPSFIQQGEQVIEIEDNVNVSITSQTQSLIQKDNKTNIPQQINANREGSVSPRPKMAEQYWITRNRNEYEKKEVQKQMNSLSNNPLSKHINRSKSPNNRSRSVTPQKNYHQS